MLIEELSWRLVGGGVSMGDDTSGLLVSTTAAIGSTTVFAVSVFVITGF